MMSRVEMDASWVPTRGRQRGQRVQVAPSSNPSMVASSPYSSPRRTDSVCTPLFRKEISPERKNAYVKGFLVWILFTALGWLSIPEQFLPFFSHCVGFGFFLMITTRQTRWLGALAVGGIAFFVVLYQALPREWIFLISQSAGYAGLILMITLACFWRVVPEKMKEELRDGLMTTRDDMLSIGSEYFEQLRLTFHLDPSGAGPGRRKSRAGTEGNLNDSEAQLRALYAETLAAWSPRERNQDHSGADGDNGIASQSSRDSPFADVTMARAPAIPERQPVALPAALQASGPMAEYHQRYLAMLRELDAKLSAKDHALQEAQTAFATLSRKMVSKLDGETELRLKAEKSLMDKDNTIAALRVEIEALKRKRLDSDVDEVRRRLKEEKEQVGHVEAARAQLARSLELEVATRQMVERDLARANEEKARLEKAMRAEQEMNKATGQGATKARQALTNEMAQRARAVDEAKYQRERADRLQEVIDQLRRDHETKASAELEAAISERGRLQAEIARIERFAGVGLESLSPAELSALEGAHEDQLRAVRTMRMVAVQVENDRLKQTTAELQDKMLCRVCLAQPIGVLLEPCGHVCTCKDCANRLKTCPLCRHDVSSSRDIFVCV